MRTLRVLWKHANTHTDPGVPSHFEILLCVYLNRLMRVVRSSSTDCLDSGSGTSSYPISHQTIIQGLTGLERKMDIHVDNKHALVLI